MWVIVGLGNPGPEYETTRHNAGFIFLDLVREKLGESVQWREQKAFEALICQVQWTKEPLLLVKPQTYMNLSGRSLQKILHFYKTPPERCIAIYDDVDCLPGTVKMRMDGGHGGHNGIRSLIECLGTNKFPRIKLGVGKPAKVEGRDTASWVLGRMTDSELKALQSTMFEEGLARLRSIVLP